MPRPPRPQLTPAGIALACIVVLALAIRLAWIAYAGFAPTLNDDAGRYDLLGRSLADGGGYINPNGTTTMFWPPGYPFILTAVYKLWPSGVLGAHELTAALILNAAFAAATVALTCALARRALDDVRTALIAAAALAVFPSMVFFAGVTLTETAFTFFAMLALWLFVEAEARRDLRLFALAGLVVGFAALVRGQAALLPLVAVPFWLASGRTPRESAARAMLAGAMALAVIAPWTVRNYVESGSLVLISNDGVNFYIGHSPGGDGRGRKVDDLVFRYPHLPQPEAEARISRDGFREGLEYALEHPAREVELVARKLFFLYYRDDEALRWTDAHGERTVIDATLRDAFAAVSNIYYWMALALALAGIALTLRRPSPASILLVSMLLYWTLIHVAFFADPRFHAPIIPIVSIFAAASINLAWSWLAGAKRVG